MEAVPEGVYIDNGLNRARRRRLVAGIALACIGVALMVVCGILAAHYSHKAAAGWFNDSARQAAAYWDSVRAEESATGRKLSQFTPGERAAVEKAARDKMWSAAYDPKSSNGGQATANALGLAGIVGFFLFSGGLILVLASGGKTRLRQDPGGGSADRHDTGQDTGGAS
jgi:hypothetical protein